MGKKLTLFAAALLVAAAASGCGDRNGNFVQIEGDDGSQEIAVYSSDASKTPPQNALAATKNDNFSQNPTKNTTTSESAKGGETAKNEQTTNNSETLPTFDALLVAGMKTDATGKSLDFSAVENLDGFNVAGSEKNWNAVKVVRGQGELTPNALLSFSKLPNLTEFLWTNATFSGDEFLAGDSFARWSELRNLKKIRLTNLRNSNDEFPHFAIAILAQIPNLVDLDVSGAPANAEDWAAVDLKNSFPKLTKLNLYQTNLGDAGVEALLPLADRLVSLNLDDAKIGQKSADKITQFTQLTFLHVGRSTLDDESVLKFANLGKLEKIHITRSNATEAGADALRAALPNCEVVSQPEK